MGIKNFFNKRSRDEVLGSKVLVCSLDPKFAELLNADSASYSRFYSTTTTATFASIEALLRAIGQGYDIIQLFCDA